MPSEIHKALALFQTNYGFQKISHQFTFLERQLDVTLVSLEDGTV